MINSLIYGIIEIRYLTIQFPLQHKTIRTKVFKKKKVIMRNFYQLQGMISNHFNYSDKQQLINISTFIKSYIYQLLFFCLDYAKLSFHTQNVSFIIIIFTNMKSVSIKLVNCSL